MSTALQKNTSHELERSGATAGVALFQPRVDIAENAEELVLYADMPGVDRETLEVSFENRVLTIRGRMASGLHPEGAASTWYEYGVGDYYRKFEVGELVDSDRINAEYADGVLTVRLPKAEAAKPRTITVKLQK